MAIEFTPAQQKVLDARDHNILVSAAAGSGKTAVLVERIVRLVSEGEHPLDIDRLLVVTFTRAAAAQMRERIGRALSARLALDPSNAHLQRQEVLLHNAQITTMDSFFTFLLRNYFSDIDLDPGFRQIDPTESKIIAGEVLRDFLEEKYTEKDPAFLHCASYFCPGADDLPLEELILELCDKAGSHPCAEAWLKERAFDYDVQNEDELFSRVWMRSMVLRLADLLLETGHTYEAMKDICLQPGGPDICYAFFAEEEQGLTGQIGALRQELQEELRRRGQDPQEAADGGRAKELSLYKKLWEEIQCAIEYSFKRFPSTRGKKYEYIDSSLKNTVQSMRNTIKDRIGKLRAAVGGQSPETILAMMQAACGPMKTLSALAVEYRKRFLEVKKEKHLIDFVDLEHFALDILAERQEDGAYLPRRAAHALRNHYAEILIDEYQDSNEVQELLLQIISGEDEGRNNRFMVGDIKQSIYRFRLARPEIFMEKYDSYRPDDPCTELIELDQNFRSRAQVLDCVNSLFLRIMRREVGGVTYNETVSLKKGAVFPDEKEKAAVSSPDRAAAAENEDAKALADKVETAWGAAAADCTIMDSDPYCAELLLLETALPEDSEEDSSGSSAAGRRDSFTQDDDTGEEQEENEDSYTVLSDEISSLTDRQKEALLIAGRIRSMVGVLPVRDEATGELRPARYGDIVILLRSTVGWNEDLRAVFAREGIPAYAESRTGYFAAQEIREIIELLRVLDNPRQDIPLYGTLRGYFGGFSQDEIAQIRMAVKEGMLYDALAFCAGEQACAGGGPEAADRAETETVRDYDFESRDNDGKKTGEQTETGQVPQDLSEKCTAFLAFLRSWRKRVRYCPVSEIVTGLLDETGYQDYCTALPAGAQRSANLRFLRSQADAFTRTDYTGLFQFLRYIDGLHRQEIDYGEANTLDENADVVRIMSIHKSKGLEFPICFAAGLSKPFSFRKFDASGPMLFDGDWGVGISYFDTVSRVSSSTLRQEEIAEKIRRDCMGEELRVLYVALTRAKEKLIMTASAKGIGKKIENWKSALAGFFHNENEGMLSPSMIVGASSFAQLICQAVMAQGGPDFDIPDQTEKPGLPLSVRLLTQKDLTMQAVEEQFDLSRCEEILRGMEGRPLAQQPDPEAAQDLASWFFRTYPHEELRDLFAQTSVSELKHRAMRTLQLAEDGTQESAAELFPEQSPVPYLPAFIRNQTLAEEGHMDNDQPLTEEEKAAGEDSGAVTAAEVEAGQDFSQKKPAAVSPAADGGAGARRGTAFHRVLELVDYKNRSEWIEGGKEGYVKLQEWLQALPAAGRIEKEDAALVSPSRVMHFMRSPLAGRMARAQMEGKLFREQPFVMGVPADRVGEGLPHDEIVTVQGIIDAFFIEDGRIILVDYKTDRVSEAAELVLRYQTQLNLYADALEKALMLPVAQKLIYSTALGGEVLI